MKQSTKAGQLIALQNRIEEQDDMIEKLKLEESKLNNYINEFKEAIKRKTSLNKSDQKRKDVGDTTKMTSQLNKEIQNAKIMLKNYQFELKNVQKKTGHLHTSDLQDLNVVLRQKQRQLKNLKEEIKDLHFVKRKQEKVIEKKEKEEDGQRLTKLMDDLRKNKELVESQRIKHQSKKEAMEKKKQTIQDLEQKYKQKCAKSGQQPLLFEEFKRERKREKKKEDFGNSKAKKQRQSIKKFQSVREIINSQPTQKVEYNERYLRELKIKKEVAETSLRNIEKKNDKQIDELERKLEILKIENENLTERLIEKRKEKDLAYNTDKLSSEKTNRKLTPIK